MVGHGGRLFDKRQGVDEMLEISQRHAGDLKIFEGPRRLDAVIGVVGQLAFAQRVVLSAHAPNRFRIFGALRGAGTQAFAHALGHPGDNAVEHLGLLLPEFIQLAAGNLPDHGAVADGGAGRVGQIVQQGAFGNERPGPQHGHPRGRPMQAAHDLHLAVQNNPGPLARGGLVKRPVARLVDDCFASFEKRLQVFRVDADRCGCIFNRLFENVLHGCLLLRVRVYNHFFRKRCR